MDMVTVELKIKKVIESGDKKHQKGESIKLLQKYGIIDKNQRVTPRYQEIIVRRTEVHD